MRRGNALVLGVMVGIIGIRVGLIAWVFIRICLR